MAIIEIKKRATDSWEVKARGQVLIAGLSHREAVKLAGKCRVALDEALRDRNQRWLDAECAKAIST